jgi:hypothetical protein
MRLGAIMADPVFLIGTMLAWLWVWDSGWAVEFVLSEEV